MRSRKLPHIGYLLALVVLLILLILKL